MKTNERSAFIDLILGTAELYEKTPGDAALELYWNALEDLELQQIEFAIGRHLRDPDKGRFMPKPADIRSCIPGAGKRTSIIAWAEVERAIFKYGIYRTVQFVDGVTNAVLKDMGAWEWICSQDLEQPWTQKEFERRYEIYQQQQIQLHEPLIGIHERENRNNGYFSDPRLPEYTKYRVLIGQHDTLLLPESSEERKQISSGEFESIGQLIN